MLFIPLTDEQGNSEMFNLQHVLSFCKQADGLTRIFFTHPMNDFGDTYRDVQETPAAIMIEMHRVKMFHHKLELMAAEEHKADKKK